MSDIQIYRDYVKANSKIKGLGFDNIPSIIEKINDRLKDNKFKHKHPHYRAEKKRLETVLRVENSQ